MITVIITAFREPKTIGKAIECFLKQTYKANYDIVVSAPDPETIEVVKTFMKKHKNVKLFKDPGKGKSYALNMLFRLYRAGILVLSDGDVFVNKVALEEIAELFKNKSMGCVSGRPVSISSRKTMIGYWSHLLADVGAHGIRKRLSKQKKFLECSGYLFAFRAGVIKQIPLDVAEDSAIPYLLWKKGFRISYAPKAEVYVKNPTILNDFIKQRKRTADAHTKLIKYFPKFPKVKSFKNEIKGIFWIWSYPQTIKELWWTFLLVFVRLYTWLSLFFDLRFKKKEYIDGWDRVSTAR